MKKETKATSKSEANIAIPDDLFKFTFLDAIREVEALSDFYSAFHGTWKKNKEKFEKTYKSGLELHNFLQKLITSDNPQEEYESQKEILIGANKLNDLVRLNFKEEETGISIGYSMQDKFANKKIHDPKFSGNEYSKFDNQYEIFVRSILSNIIIIFERYFAQVYEFTVLLNPDAYFESKTIKISELLHCTTTELIRREVRNHVAENMYDSMKTIDTMKTKSKFNLDRHLAISKEFKEIYYRRNIFVHNSGVVNDAYYNNVAPEYQNKTKHGIRLNCDETYIQDAIITLKKVICICYYELISVNKLNIELLDTLFGKVAFSALCNQEYDFCKDIFYILSKYPQLSFAMKTMSHVNYMITLKQTGGAIDNLLQDFDVSAMEKKFKVAKECLLGNNSQVYSLLLEMYPKDMPAENIRDWPLFIDFRKSLEYEKFKNENAADFNQYTFEDEDKTEVELEEAVKNEELKISKMFEDITLDCIS